MTEFTLTQWVIYYNPSDYPGKYVVRAWHTTSDDFRPAENAIVKDNIDEARQAIPPYLYRLPCFEDDDKAIIEVWI